VKSFLFLLACRSELDNKLRKTYLKVVREKRKAPSSNNNRCLSRLLLAAGSALYCFSLKAKMGTNVFSLMTNNVTHKFYSQSGDLGIQTHDTTVYDDSDLGILFLHDLCLNDK
jgi:hypothetical protein